MAISRRQTILQYLITVWVIATLNFFLPRMMPGDPFLLLSADAGEDVAPFSEAQRRHYIAQYGLDRPWLQQYGVYLAALCRGDLGRSIYYNDPVADILVRRLPWTLSLVLAAVALSTAAGTVLGSVSAHRRGGWTDRLLYAGLIVISEVPAFLLGLVLLFVFAAGLRLFPLSGAMTPFADYASFWDRLVDLGRHAVLPVATLAIVRSGGMYLLARNSMTTVLAKDYLRTARAKGLGTARIFYRHSLRNALLPITTRVFLSLGSLVGGAILVENVFAYPGLGRLMRDAVLAQDYPLIQGIFLLVTVSVLTANFAADFVYARIDPRIAAAPPRERTA